ncbi:MAG TPA: ATP-dependent protease, partial [Syntrophobacteria bacterium]|nr:ATP-dependent protease [Syntrophobacteria bacterium]
NLMLKHEVVDAVAQGRFHLYPVQSIEEGIEILTGAQAGERQPDGTYPDSTIFRKVDDRLRQMAETAREFAKGKEEGEKEGEKKSTS